jgi:hypothetical protein
VYPCRAGGAHSACREERRHGRRRGRLESLRYAIDLNQPAMLAAEQLLCFFPGALALRARWQIFGYQVIFVARRSDGLAAKGEDAYGADMVANPNG